MKKTQVTTQIIILAREITAERTGPLTEKWIAAYGYPFICPQDCAADFIASAPRIAAIIFPSKKPKAAKK